MASPKRLLTILVLIVAWGGSRCGPASGAGDGERPADFGAAQVDVIDLSHRKDVTDATLKRLAVTRDVRGLNLAGCIHVTDAGVRELARCAHLRELDLTGCY